MSSQSKEWLRMAVEEESIILFDYSLFEEVRRIASGAFGTVYSAHLKSEKKIVALKSLHSDETTGDDIYREFVRELRNISSVDHENINKFMGVSLDTSTNIHFLVLQYANEGNLRSYLHKHFKELDWPTKIRMAKEIASGLDCIHEAKIVHRDLHSKNILLHEGRLMIADLGLSKSLYDNSASIEGAGMPAYTDPQYLKDTSYKRDEASDIYSLGVLLWELSSGRNPFDKISKLATASRTIAGKREIPVDGTPLDYLNVYTSAWNHDPLQRPTIKSIRSSLEIIQMEPVYRSVKENPLWRRLRLRLEAMAWWMALVAEETAVRCVYDF